MIPPVQRYQFAYDPAGACLAPHPIGGWVRWTDYCASHTPKDSEGMTELRTKLEGDFVRLYQEWFVHRDKEWMDGLPLSVFTQHQFLKHEGSPTCSAWVSRGFTINGASLKDVFEVIVSVQRQEPVKVYLRLGDCTSNVVPLGEAVTSLNIYLNARLASPP